MIEFSRHWVSSKKPKKQRKYGFTAPLHIRKNMLASHLSKDLKKKFGRRSVPVRKGDRVKILRGEFKKRSGKVEKVDHKDLRVYIEGIERVKRDGTKVRIALHPSNLLIQELDMEDKMRKMKLEANKVKA